MVDILLVHQLLARGSCSDMAVEAGLIAQVTQIDLQDFQRGTPYRREIGVFQ